MAQKDMQKNKNHLHLFFILYCTVHTHTLAPFNLIRSERFRILILLGRNPDLQDNVVQVECDVLLSMTFRSCLSIFEETFCLTIKNNNSSSSRSSSGINRQSESIYFLCEYNWSVCSHKHTYTIDFDFDCDNDRWAHAHLLSLSYFII